MNIYQTNHTCTCDHCKACIRNEQLLDSIESRVFEVVDELMANGSGKDEAFDRAHEVVADEINQERI